MTRTPARWAEPEKAARELGPGRRVTAGERRSRASGMGDIGVLLVSPPGATAHNTVKRADAQLDDCTEMFNPEEDIGEEG